MLRYNQNPPFPERASHTENPETLMSATTERRIAQVLTANEAEILSDWLKRQQEEGRTRYDEVDVRDRSRSFLRLLTTAVQHGDLTNPEGSNWHEIHDLLADLSRARAQQGFSPSDTATFVFSLKQPLFDRLRREFGADADSLADAVWSSGTLLDKLGLYTTEIHQKRREEVIARQQQELLELSTPVVQLWDGILALPMIGTLDSARTQVVMESLLERIVETSARIAIIDITGVPTVDTLVAQHLLKTVAAARLMGADCIISGIRPQIAQTIVHLGVELGTVVTKATLADAFRVAMQRTNLMITSAKAGA
jgi:rsbT co-antagonist protein RsbR